MNIQAARHSDRLCKALTGLTVDEFTDLESQFTWNAKEYRIEHTPNRQRKIGGGRKGHVPTATDRLFVILMYLKAYPTYDLLGFLIGSDRSNACRLVLYLLPILEQTLKRKLVLPKRKIRSVEEFLEAFPEVKDVLIDGTDRRVKRPVSAKRQKKLYSGKQKTTTRKNIIVTDDKGTILILSPTKSGRRHDKRLLEKAGLHHIPPAVAAWVDTGFQGLQRMHTNTQIPKKRRKDRPLTDEEKANNRVIGSIRVAVEHTIAGVKRLQSTKQVYRNHRSNLDDTFMLLATGLWNYHLAMKPA